MRKIDSHRSMVPPRALAALRTAAVALGLFFTSPNSDAIDEITSAVTWPVPPTIGNLGLISPAQGQPVAPAKHHDIFVADLAAERLVCDLRRSRRRIPLVAEEALIRHARPPGLLLSHF